MTSAYLALVGPTASGKTDLGVQLAQEQNAEIISVDSRQVYKYLSVGTAKPTSTHGIPYHLIDFLEPDQSFSAAHFVERATVLVKDIQARRKTIIFVGGTGLYFKALTEGLAPLPPASPEVRERLNKEADQIGRAALHARLATIDPEAAEKIPANNIQRLIRALEVYELTGKPISEWHKEHRAAVTPVKTAPATLRVQGHAPTLAIASSRGGVQFNLKFIGLDPGKEELQHRIETRCQRMMTEGMIEETQSLLGKGYSETCPALTGLGYPRIIALLKGSLSKDECLRLLIQDTRQYAKRQRTWFRHQLEVQWKK